jgi:UDP-N-acetylmuramoyl-tripeptide--D-alanyl-D-alanine ligase
VLLERPVPGEPFLRSALLALAAADAVGVSARDAAARLPAFRAPTGRMNVTSIAGVTLVDDTYNANPASVAASLETLASLAAPAQRIAVLGGMAELGAAGPEHHRAVGRQAARAGLRLLVTVGDDARAIAQGAREAGLGAARVVEVASADDVAAAVRPHLAPGRVVTFKASRVHRLERAVAATRAALIIQPARHAAQGAQAA